MFVLTGVIEWWEVTVCGPQPGYIWELGVRRSNMLPPGPAKVEIESKGKKDDVKIMIFIILYNCTLSTKTPLILLRLLDR